MLRTTLIAAAFAAAPLLAPAQPANRCSHETLSVRGTPVTFTYCVSPPAHNLSTGSTLALLVEETFSTPKASFSQRVTHDFLAGEITSRAVEDLPLARLGLQGTLHLTLMLRGGTVSIGSAILTPGAVTVK